MEERAPEPEVGGDERGPARARWTHRRIVATAVNSVAGFLVGVFLTPMMLGVGTVLMSRGVGTLGMLLMVGLSTGIVAYCTRGTCQRHPAAPLGIAIGLAIGTSLWAVLPLMVTFAGPRGLPWEFLLGAMVLTGSHPWLAFEVGKRSLVVNLGEIRRGIGRTCASCGYDVSVTPEGWPCPECNGELRYERRPEDSTE